MGGTREGGLKAAAVNKLKHGDDFYKKIGKDGGEISRGGGFADHPERAVEAGRKGGKVSRRTKVQIAEQTAPVALSFKCPDCYAMFKSEQGLAAHRRLLPEHVAKPVEVRVKPVVKPTPPVHDYRDKKPAESHPWRNKISRFFRGK